jgi:hypothetical protein
MSLNKKKNYQRRVKGRAAEAIARLHLEKLGYMTTNYDGHGADIVFSAMGWYEQFTAEVKSLQTPGGQHDLRSGAKDVRPMDTVSFNIDVQKFAEKVHWVIAIDVEKEIVYPFSREKLLMLQVPCKQFKIDNGFGGRQSKRGKNPPLHPCEIPPANELVSAKIGQEDLDPVKNKSELFY